MRSMVAAMICLSRALMRDLAAAQSPLQVDDGCCDAILSAPMHRVEITIDAHRA